MFTPNTASNIRARRRRRKVGALVTPFALVALLSVAFAPPAAANHEPVGQATFPGSNWRCSSAQKSFLRTAWQEAYSYTKRAESLVDHIAARPADDERRQLWEQDFLGFGTASNPLHSPSPQRYFGDYNHARLNAVSRALEIARKRFEGKTMYLITCSKVCAADPSAHHAVLGRIVTCSKFWRRVNGTDTYSRRLAQAAFTLTHEVLHHVSVKVDGVWRPIGDYHTLGVPDGKYYGITDVTYLARHAPKVAVRNNDSYAFFAQQAHSR